MMRITLKTVLAKVDVCFCVCFCLPVSIAFPNYEAVGFQPKAVDINDKVMFISPDKITSPPMLKMHASD